ncbi:hypothetical protein LguiB_035234 [Lonicera macranthoides]
MSSNSSFNTATPNFDNLLLQTLMGRLQIRPPNLLNSPNPFLNQTLEDLLLDTINNLSSDNEEDDEDPSSDNRTQLAKEESKLEKEIIKTILGGKSDTLKPNSGQAVTIGEHHICVGYHEESGSDYRVWEWHGHIMLFDEENGYTPEYIYGNYFERVIVKPVVVNKDDDDEKEEDKIGNLGLRELIETVESGTGRILHRNMNAPRSCVIMFKFHGITKQLRVMKDKFYHIIEPYVFVDE